MAITITEPTADELVNLAFQHKLRASASADLENDTKYAVCLLKLHSAMTPGDYPALKTAIEGVTGVQNISLLIDHQTRASVPEYHVQVLRMRADVTLRDDTPVEPE